MLILASSSPRRKSILDELGVRYISHANNDPEVVDTSLSPVENAKQIALQKAKSVAKHYPHKWVLGVDTLVSIDNQIVGKAANQQEARATLNKLSGRQHEVISGIALMKNDQSLCYAEVTKIWFRKFTEDDLDDYIRSGIWKGKSGAFTIQGRGALYIEKIEGDYWNVVGLPIHRFGQMCAEIGLKI